MECKLCLFSSDNYSPIQLDESGVCSICEINNKKISETKNQQNRGILDKKIAQIKKSKYGKYDCLIGISGGRDSSYLVYLAKKWKLNPLLFHLDGGWNSEISVKNMKNVVDKSGFDFVTEVLPWQEMQDVQRAFIKANVLDIDLPFDNAMLNYNYQIARKFKIKYILNGFSSCTEGIMPDSFTHYKFDKKNILHIHQKFGNQPLKNLKFIGTFDYLRYLSISKIQFLQPLDWIAYDKNEAEDFIKTEFNWQEYGGKHYENVFTRFYQGHILPKKYGIDKRISHFSMLICNGNLSKSEALEALAKSPLYANETLESEDKAFFCKKLDLSSEEFKNYMQSSGKSHRDFKSDLDAYDFFKPIYQRIKKIFKFDIFRN